MIDTERKEDLFLDTKLIKSENRLGKLRIIDELHPVLGGQPTHEADQPNDNNPFLDLACTMQFTIDKVNAVDKKADTKLAKAQNLKDVANVAIARDNLGLGTSSTMNATSTLSDRTDQTATIKAVNDVNRAASTAQKTANNAHALAQTKQDKLTFVGDGPDVMKTGAFGIGEKSFSVNKAMSQEEELEFFRNKGMCVYRNSQPTIYNDNKTYSPSLLIATDTSYANFSVDFRTGVITVTSGRLTEEVITTIYSTSNTTIDKSGFLRASGSANAVITTDLATKSKAGITRLDSSLSDAEDRAATPKAVNDVNRAASTAQKTANNAHALAQSKQDKLPFIGDGPEVMKKGAFGLGSITLPRFNELNDLNNVFESGFYGLANNVTNAPENTSQGATLINLSYSISAGAQLLFKKGGEPPFFRGKTMNEWGEWNQMYSTSNTTPDKSGFLRASGSANALVESDVTNSLGNSKSLVASQFLTSDVAQKATNAHYRADEAYDLANSKWSPQATTGTGNIARMSEVQKAQQMGGLGYGQSWQNVTGSRSVGATYTNNTGKPIQIFVKDDTGTGNKNLTLVVNGTAMGFTAQSGNRIIINQIIPIGASYRIDGRHNGWWELR